MTVLLDTHFVLWLTTGARQAKRYRWLEKYCPWSVSPVSLLEIDFLFEVGSAGFSGSGFAEMLSADDRFLIDDIGLATLVEHAHELGWTRDPFDRLLVAHSRARRMPLCTTDDHILGHHTLLPREMRKK